MTTGGVRKSLIAAALFFVASAGPFAHAFAQGAAVIKIGNEMKNTRGVLIDAVAGDVACYISLKNDKGVEFTEMTGFEFCENWQALKGKRVVLTYGFGIVLAEECMGNPDCKKTRRAVVVDTVKVIDAGTRKK